MNRNVLARDNLPLKGRIYSEWGSLANFAEAIDWPAPYVSLVIKRRKELSEADQELWAGMLRCSLNEFKAIYSNGTSDN